MVLLQNVQQAPECTKQGAPALEEGRRGLGMASPERNMENHRDVDEYKYLLFPLIIFNLPHYKTNNKQKKT